MKIYTTADFYGGVIQQIEQIEEWEDCADLCLANNQCFYFTYQEARRTCWLKDWIKIFYFRYINHNIFMIKRIFSTKFYLS